MSSHFCTALDIPHRPIWYKNVPMTKNYIREIRITKGWSQEKLAEVMGTTAATIQRHEQGKRRKSLDMDTIRRYAEALECHPSDITDGPGSLVPKNEIQKKILQAMNQLSDKEQEMYGSGFLSGLNMQNAGEKKNDDGDSKPAKGKGS